MCCAGAIIAQLKTYAVDSPVYLSFNHMPAKTVAMIQICEPVSRIVTLELHIAPADIIAQWDW